MKILRDHVAVVRSATQVVCKQSTDNRLSCVMWRQPHGFSSHNGRVAVISINTVKFLDVEAVSNACKQCQIHSHFDKDSVENQFGVQITTTALQTPKDLHKPWSLKGLSAYLEFQEKLINWDIQNSI